ncbi:enoyl-CoA hydratase/isomerase family protein [Vibrio makurazakiensis]|uniref:enoyl-CoA hydratase/isomerase family protein n=1 Tax=Vibrio makurazakiensis TaxID=2910250 RepID=UPI003D0FAE10
MAGKVNFELLNCHDGQHYIALATLDNPESLNALTYEMLEQLNRQLNLWQNDEKVVCVLLLGSGGKAFCAGGDVRTMYKVMNEQHHTKVRKFCTEYFSLEYQCDYLIHTYTKPILAWGEGIVMGGGMGLFMGASHKVVTPKSRLAMPEVTIGLFPDVGGTWFLNRLESGVGMFLGMTGAMLNASDAVELHLADYLVLEGHQSELFTQLQSTQWQAEEDHYSVLSGLLEGFKSEASLHKPKHQMLSYLPQIEFACRGDDLALIRQSLLDIEASHGDESQAQWLENAQKSMLSGSPITAHILFRQIKLYHDLSLADCFRLELNLAVRSSVLGEFREGVRARLIDKCGEPNWIFESLYEVDNKVIDTLFNSLWSDENHPLSDLGKY